LLTSVYKIHFADKEFLLDAAGALYWPLQKTLIISDLHFEKGSYFAAKGNPLPIHDTRDTLLRIELLIEKHTPERVISLGDSFHDYHALNRIRSEDIELLNKLMKSVANWDWVLGNHDTGDYSDPSLEHLRFCADRQIEGIVFTHDLLPDAGFQVVGHFHPKTTVTIKHTRITGKCFVVTGDKLFMPAFGSYTGGLAIQTPTFQSALNNRQYSCFLLAREQIWRIK
jgi:DNA ligase-associated metallophosphoesterase